MTTTGGFGVSESGAVAYEIAVRVPPGTSGMEPKLSLAYNSQAGSGLAGMGLSLSGLSMITRCPRTLAQDSVRGAVNYDANDRFCLDGQRLIVIAGAYGTDGAEYRTERDSFTRIFSRGVAGTGPAWFQAWTKAGQQVEYGNTADSRAEAQGKTSARLWGVNKVMDTMGNYITFTYTDDQVNGDHYPTGIDYTANAGSVPVLTANQSVRFVYEARPDVVPVYQAGSLSKSTVRLKNVQTFVGASLVTDYRVAYDTSTVSGRSRAVSITECSPSVCLPATTLGWSGTAPSFSSASWPANHVNSLTSSQNWFGDFNGDGRSDMISVTNGTTFNMHLSNGTGFTQQTWTGNVFLDGTGNARLNWIADFNGDGKADIINGFNPASAVVNISTGAGFTLQNWPAQFSSQSDANLIGDFNGDGRADIASYDSAGVVRMHLSTGTGFTVQTWASNLFFDNSGPSRLNWVGDFNGDGRSDIASADTAGNIRVHLSTGSGFDIQNWPSNHNAADARENLVGDFNGDGKADIAAYDSAGIVRMHLSTGTGFVIQNWVSNLFVDSFGSNRWNWLGDFNGDGKTDIASFADASTLRVHLSTGTGFNIQNWTTTHNAVDQGKNMTADFDGDGRTDIAAWDSTTAVRVNRVTAAYPDFLASVTSGFGAVDSVVYKTLTDPSVYTRDTTAVYPVQDLQAPMYVAATRTSSNGIGGTVTTSYAYTGAKIDFTGRGLLGFRIVQQTDAAGLKNITTHRQDWPYIGLPSQMKRTRADNVVISQVDNTFACKDLDADPDVCTIAAGKRYFPYVSQSDEQSFDLNGVFMTKTRTANGFDSFGNATQVIVSHLNADNSATGYVKTTSNLFTNDTANWVLGRLTQSTLKSDTP